MQPHPADVHQVVAAIRPPLPRSREEAGPVRDLQVERREALWPPIANRDEAKGGVVERDRKAPRRVRRHREFGDVPLPASRRGRVVALHLRRRNRPHDIRAAVRLPAVAAHGVPRPIGVVRPIAELDRQIVVDLMTSGGSTRTVTVRAEEPQP